MESFQEAMAREQQRLELWLTLRRQARELIGSGRTMCSRDGEWRVRGERGTFVIERGRPPVMVCCCANVPDVALRLFENGVDLADLIQEEKRP